MAGYKYLLWDLDGTILNFLQSERAAIKAMFEKYGLGECTDEMVERYSGINAGYWLKLEMGLMTKQQILIERFHTFFREYGIDPSCAESFNMDYQLALGDTIVFCDGAMDVLKEEKGKYVLAAITNGTARAQRKKLKESRLDRIFDYIFISEDVGAEKPAPAFFSKVINDMKIEDLSEALVIGDSLTSDITGGKNAGIATCWYNPEGVPNDRGVIPDYEIRDLKDISEIL